MREREGGDGLERKQGKGMREDLLASRPSPKALCNPNMTEPLVAIPFLGRSKRVKGRHEEGRERKRGKRKRGNVRILESF